MNAALEGRYRSALRWYPRAWRVENADAIVGTMLDQADAEARDVPRSGELRNLATSGIAARIERFAPQAVRDRVATIALALGFTSSLIMFVFAEWAPFATTGPWNNWRLPGEVAYVPATLFETSGFGPFASANVVVYALWIVGFALAIFRFSHTAAVSIALTIPVLIWINSLPRYDEVVSMRVSTLGFIILGGLALLVAIGRPVRVGRPAIGLTVASALLALVAVLALNPPIWDGRLWAYIPVSMLNAPLLWVLMVFAGIQFAVLRRRAWSAALLISSVPWAILFWKLFGGSPLALVVLVCVAALSLAAAVVIWRYRAAPRSTA